MRITWDESVQDNASSSQPKRRDGTPLPASARMYARIDDVPGPQHSKSGPLGVYQAERRATSQTGAYNTNGSTSGRKLFGVDRTMPRWHADARKLHGWAQNLPKNEFAKKLLGNVEFDSNWIRWSAARTLAEVRTIIDTTDPRSVALFTSAAVFGDEYREKWIDADPAPSPLYSRSILNPLDSRDTILNIMLAHGMEPDALDDGLPLYTAYLEHIGRSNAKWLSNELKARCLESLDHARARILHVKEQPANYRSFRSRELARILKTHKEAADLVVIRSEDFS
ncbi:hypothetical protein PENSPDRAFT_695518 [Peniophora sp. CONT]|nr:hypothetical protein PENSPDRAFT_695518 [Peniophora sp. CONT]